MKKQLKVLKRTVVALLFLAMTSVIAPAAFAIQDLDTLKGGETITLEDCLNHAFTHSPHIKKAKNNILK